MPELENYRQYNRDETIAACGPVEKARPFGDGQWVVLPERVLCFAEVGLPLKSSYFLSPNTFHLDGRLSYPFGSLRHPVAERILQGPTVHRNFELFVRKADEELYTYIDSMFNTHYWQD